MQYHLFDTTTRWQRVSVLIELGGAALDDFKDRDATPEFQPWFVAVKEMAAIKQVNLAQADAEWLWDVLRSEPSVQAEFGNLSAAGTPWFQQTEHFHVLNQGERFAIGLNSATVHQLLQTADGPTADPVPTVRLLEKLRMRPGKASRLECCNVLCELTIPVEEMGTAEREAEILRVEPQLIRLSDHQLTVIAKSLNQALTIATRRLEPDRRAPAATPITASYISAKTPTKPSNKSVAKSRPTIGKCRRLSRFDVITGSANLSLNAQKTPITLRQLSDT